MRAVAATTVVWIIARIAFWVGYHRSSAQRGLGAPGMMLSARCCSSTSTQIEMAGVVGAIVPLACSQQPRSCSHGQRDRTRTRRRTRDTSEQIVNARSCYRGDVAATGSVRYGATTSRVSLLGTTGTNSIVTPNPRHCSTHSCSTRGSSQRIS